MRHGVALALSAGLVVGLALIALGPGDADDTGTRDTRSLGKTQAPQVTAPQVPKAGLGGLRRLSPLRVAEAAHGDSLGRRTSRVPGVGAEDAVLEYLSDHVARVRVGRGRTAVVSSMLPLRVSGGRGRKRAVDLSL